MKTEEGFNQNRILRAFVLSLIDGGVSAFVETGTLWGDSCLWVAKRRPNLPIYTCEINQSAVVVAKEKFVPHPQIHLCGSRSSKFLKCVMDQIGDLPLFYLDAHNNEEWPILGELEIVGMSGKSACMIIHDFQVPGIPQFGHEGRNGIPLNVDYIGSSLLWYNKYDLFYPARFIPGAGLQGWCVLFQNTVLFGNLGDLRRGEL